MRRLFTFFALSSIGDGTPGGSANAILLEDGIFGMLLEDGSSFALME